MPYKKHIFQTPKTDKRCQLCFACIRACAVNATYFKDNKIHISGSLVKKLFNPDKIVFIAPCLSFKNEVFTGKTDIDAVISFVQLKDWFDQLSINLNDLEPKPFDATSEQANNRLFLLPGNFSKILGLSEDLTNTKVIDTSGYKNCVEVLKSMQKGSLNPKFVNLMLCEKGCTSNPQVDPSADYYEKLSRFISYALEFNSCQNLNKINTENIKKLDLKVNNREFTAIPVPTENFSEEQVWSMLNKIDKYKESVLIDCGACGYSSCWEHGVTVLSQNSDLEKMCMPFLLESYKKHINELTALLLYSKKLEQQASTDGLTNLLNHRIFQEEFENQIEIAKRENKKLALFLIDIDHFKNINDIYGHLAGDSVLVELANLIQNFFKDGITARYGGEEFVVILTDIEKDKVLRAADEFVKIVSQHVFKIKKINAKLRITVSIGVSLFPESAMDRDGLLRSADYALYRAKEKRNCAVMYSSILDDLKFNVSSNLKKQMLVLNSVKTLNIILDAKDNYTYKHSERVTAYAEKLARSLNVSSKELKLLKYGAFLHDIGKVNIDSSILLKPGKLTDEEFSIIKQHPIIGAEIVKKIEPLNNEIVISAILHHHERYDGKGYPHGLKGKEIPL